jgi:hypothetical protein
MFENAIVKFRILFWCASATVLIFSYFIEKRKSQTSEISGFLFYSALLTFIILFDDYFLIHHFFRKVLHLKNTFFYLIYPVITAVIIKFYFKEIKGSNFLIIVIAYCFLGLGVIIDLLSDGKLIYLSNSDLYEDICKLLGSFIWLTYFSGVTYKYIFRRISTINNFR